MSSAVPAVVARGRGFYKPEQPYVLAHPVLHAPFARVTTGGIPTPMPLPRTPAPPPSRSYYSAVVNGPVVTKAPVHAYVNHHVQADMAPVIPRAWPSAPVRAHLGILIEFRAVQGTRALGLLDAPLPDGYVHFPTLGVLSLSAFVGHGLS